MNWQAIKILAFAYILGSVPVSFIVAVFWRKDLRKVAYRSGRRSLY